MPVERTCFQIRGTNSTLCPWMFPGSAVKIDVRAGTAINTNGEIIIATISLASDRELPTWLFAKHHHTCVSNFVWSASRRLYRDYAYN